MKPNYEGYNIVYPIEMIDENQSAIVLNGNDLIKVRNLKRKYNKIINNPNLKIITVTTKDHIDVVYDKYIAFRKIDNLEPQIKNNYAPKYYWNVPGTKIWCPTDLEENEFKHSSKYRNDYVLSTKEEYDKCFHD